MKLALALAVIVGATSVSAAPYYVGEKVKQNNNVSLGIADAPTKKGGLGASTGNILTVNLNANYIPMENVNVRLGAPMFWASKNAAVDTGKSRTSFGNVNLGGGYTWTFMTPSKAWEYGISLSGDVYTPTARKGDAFGASLANPTIDWFRYSSKAWGIVPQATAYLTNDMFTFKGNLGYGYQRLSTNPSNTKKNLNHYDGQLAASYHIMPTLQGNLEYNMLVLDKNAPYAVKRLKHAITPSVSGNYNALIAAAQVTIPLDSATRDITNVSFGINAGYSF